MSHVPVTPGICKISTEQDIYDIFSLQSIASQAGQAGTAGGTVGTGAGSAVPASGGSSALSGGTGFGGAYGGGFAVPNGAGGYGASVPNADGGVIPSGSVPNLFSRFGDQGVAFASGSVGLDGVQQTAAVYPENPVSKHVGKLYLECQLTVFDWKLKSNGPIPCAMVIH